MNSYLKYFTKSTIGRNSSHDKDKVVHIVFMEVEYQGLFIYLFIYSTGGGLSVNEIHCAHVTL